MKKIFNSLGSNYNFTDVLHLLAAPSDKKYREQLVSMLKKKYTGSVTLTYKGREAIELALQYAHLPKGSSVAINGFTCYVVYKPVRDQNLSVVYLDVEDGSLNFSAKQLETALKKEKNIRAVIVQNTLGYSADISAIEKICQREKIILIEDIAHSVGSIYSDGREVGTIGDFVCLSFSQDKMIDAVSGGALIVRSKNHESRIKELEIGDVNKNQQFKDQYYPLFTYLIRLAYGFGIGKIVHVVFKIFRLLSNPMGEEDKFLIHNLPDSYAYGVIRQFEKFNEIINHRKKIAAIYVKNLDHSILVGRTYKETDRGSNIRFPILIKKRRDLVNFLQERGVFISDIWYDAPIAPKKYMKKTDYNHSCPNSEHISEKILNLPTHKNVTEDDAKFIAEKINEWLKVNSKS